MITAAHINDCLWLFWKKHDDATQSVKLRFVFVLSIDGWWSRRRASTSIYFILRDGIEARACASSSTVIETFINLMKTHVCMHVCIFLSLCRFTTKNAVLCIRLVIFATWASRKQRSNWFFLLVCYILFFLPVSQ